jgi:hypothetical protein
MASGYSFLQRAWSYHCMVSSRLISITRLQSAARSWAPVSELEPGRVPWLLTPELGMSYQGGLLSHRRGAELPGIERPVRIRGPGTAGRRGGVGCPRGQNRVHPRSRRWDRLRTWR